MKSVYNYLAYYVLMNTQRAAVAYTAPNALDIMIFTVLSRVFF